MDRFIIGTPTFIIQAQTKTLRDNVTRFNSEILKIQDIQVEIMVKAMKKEAWHREFFDSLEKSVPKTIQKLIKKAVLYICLDDTLRVKRQQDLRFNKKRIAKEKPSDNSDKRKRKDDM